MHPVLVIAGQAHLTSYLPAATPPAEQVIEREVGGAIVLDGPLPRDDAYWSHQVERARGGTAAIVWGGNQHDIFLVETQPPLDFVLSTAPDLPLDRRASYVSESQLRAVFAPSFAGLAGQIAALRNAGARVLLAGTTPPIDHAEGRTGRGDEPPADTPPHTSAYTMQKLWSLIQTMTAEIATAAGAGFVPVPDRLRSPDGFLLEQYRGADLRPNAAFGGEMIAELTSVAQMTGDGQ